MQPDPTWFCSIVGPAHNNATGVIDNIGPVRIRSRNPRHPKQHSATSSAPVHCAIITTPRRPSRPPLSGNIFRWRRSILTALNSRHSVSRSNRWRSPLILEIWAQRLTGSTSTTRHTIGRTTPDHPCSRGQTVRQSAADCSPHPLLVSCCRRALPGRSPAQAGRLADRGLFGLARLASSCGVSRRVGGVVGDSGGRGYTFAGCALRNLWEASHRGLICGTSCRQVPLEGEPAKVYALPPARHTTC
ncbi:MAG: hypothetical protein ACI9N0_002878 [Ilumatobacter sp.]